MLAHTCCNLGQPIDTGFATLDPAFFAALSLEMHDTYLRCLCCSGSISTGLAVKDG
jgi:hypothetical protein